MRTDRAVDACKELEMSTFLKICALAVTAAAALLVTQPSQAADITHNIWHGTVNVAHGVADFVDKL